MKIILAKIQISLPDLKIFAKQKPRSLQNGVFYLNT